LALGIIDGAGLGTELTPQFPFTLIFYFQHTREESRREWKGEGINERNQMCRGKPGTTAGAEESNRLINLHNSFFFLLVLCFYFSIEQIA
jgi:hypothetical protein